MNVYIFSPHVAHTIEKERRAVWPLHDIPVSNIVWCLTFKRGVGGGGVGSYITQ